MLDPFFGNISDPQSLHKYTYVHGNPIDNIDPSGLMSVGGMLGGMSIGQMVSAMKIGASMVVRASICGALSGMQIGAIFGAIDAALEHDATFESTLGGAINGAAMGFVGGLVFGGLAAVASPVIVFTIGAAFGIPSTISGVRYSWEAGNPEQAAWRAVGGTIISIFANKLSNLYCFTEDTDIRVFERTYVFEEEIVTSTVTSNSSYKDYFFATLISIVIVGYTYSKSHKDYKNKQHTHILNHFFGGKNT
jgi:hypothetical protein